MSRVVKRGDYLILEQGYRPNGTVDTSKPPKGGSAVLMPSSSVRHEQHTERKSHDDGRHKK